MNTNIHLASISARLKDIVTELANANQIKLESIDEDKRAWEIRVVDLILNHNSQMLDYIQNIVTELANGNQIALESFEDSVAKEPEIQSILDVSDDILLQWHSTIMTELKNRVLKKSR